MTTRADAVAAQLGYPATDVPVEFPIEAHLAQGVRAGIDTSPVRCDTGHAHNRNEAFATTT